MAEIVSVSSAGGAKDNRTWQNAFGGEVDYVAGSSSGG
jgi:hypothetical protein